MPVKRTSHKYNGGDTSTAWTFVKIKLTKITLTFNNLKAREQHNSTCCQLPYMIQVLALEPIYIDL